MPATVIKFSEITEPKLKFDDLDGKSHEYGLYDIYEKIEANRKVLKEDFTTADWLDAIARAFDLPLPHYIAQFLYVTILERMSELDVTKKLTALTANSLPSTAGR